MVTDKEILKFYDSAEWHRTRDYVRYTLDHNECQMCKAQGKVVTPDVVHHVHHIKADGWPNRLDIYVDGKRNLVSLCDACHAKMHPEKMHFAKPRPLLTEEWW